MFDLIGRVCNPLAGYLALLPQTVVAEPADAGMRSSIDPAPSLLGQPPLRALLFATAATILSGCDRGCSRAPEEPDPKPFTSFAPPFITSRSTTDADLMQCTGVDIIKGSVAESLAHLPEQNPAKKLADAVIARCINSQTNEGQRASFLALISALSQIEQLKGVGVFYDAGLKIGDRLTPAQKEGFRALYVGAGYNFGAAALPMALIGKGAASVELTMTDLQPAIPEVMWQRFDLWSQVNPDLKLIAKKEIPARTTGGKRVSMEMTYRGKPIAIVYAIHDSPGTLYFHPADLNGTDNPRHRGMDLVVIQDVSDELGPADVGLIPSVLDHLAVGVSPWVIVTNELDSSFNLEGRWAGAIESVLPFRGDVITGPYGCARDQVIRRLGLTLPMKMENGPYVPSGEIGLSDHGSAILFSTSATKTPLLQAMKAKGIPATWLGDIAMLAGGAYDVTPGLPHSPVSRLREVRHEPKPFHEKDPIAILKNASVAIKELSGEDRDLLVLVSARAIIMKIHEMRMVHDESSIPTFLTQIPKDLSDSIREVLGKKGLPKEWNNPSSDPVAAVKGIDTALKALQK